ncbi:MAG: histidine kinase [Methylotenera sp.]|nr:MAG: histidine kinase [Methylotenera sp.]
MDLIWQSLKSIWYQIWRGAEKVIALLGGRTIATLAGTLLITIISVILGDNQLVKIDRQNHLIAQIRTTIATVQQLQTNLYRAESAQRGYLYTNRATYVEPFNRALNDARENIMKIEMLINQTSTGKEQAEELEWLRAISGSLEAKIAEMKVTLDLVETGKKLEAQHVTNLDAGLIEMKKFIEYTNMVIRNQTALLEINEQRRSDTLLMTRIMKIATAIILILLVSFVLRQLLSEIAVKSQLQLQVAKENEIYEHKLAQQSKLLRSLALDYQADVERERQKLSRELHDELGSILTATKMDVSWLMKKLKEVSPPALSAELLDKLKITNRYIDQGINFKRQVVQELHPSMISTFGFWPALRSLIEDAVSRNHWQLTLNLPEETTVLQETLSLVAYRIVQETLNNANKYAKATAVSIHMMLDEKFLKIEIQDNGVGIDMVLLKGNTHGLSGMRHRVLAIGGHFELDSEPGKGLLTRALLPLDITS